MAINIATSEVTKVVQKTMEIGITTHSDIRFISHIVGEQTRYLRYNTEALRVLGWSVKITEKRIGWGCHSLKPSEFKKALKAFKQPNTFYSGSGDCDIKAKSLVNVVKIYSNGHRSVDKAELIEKMEILLKAHSFLYKK